MEEVGFVKLVEVTVSEEGTRAKDEMVPMGVGPGPGVGLQGSCLEAIEMGVLESRAGQVLGTLMETGSTATREDAPAQEEAQA